jgi:hypothetical protein
MKKILILAIIALAIIISTVSAEDFIKTNGGMPTVKDLGNLSLEEISAIFSGGDSWFMSGGLMSQWTPSQIAFMGNDASDGKPMGPGTGKMAYVGSSVPSN